MGGVRPGKVTCGRMFAMAMLLGGPTFACSAITSFDGFAPTVAPAESVGEEDATASTPDSSDEIAVEGSVDPTGMDATADRRPMMDAIAADVRDGSIVSDGAADGADGADAGPPCVTGFACTPLPPAGWGAVPFALYEGALGTAPGCGSGFDSKAAYNGNSGLLAPPASCSSCGCGSGSGVTCSTVAQLYAGAGCSNPCPGGPKTVTGTCSPITHCQSNESVKVTGTPTGGSCPPSGGAPSKSLSWQRVARACSADAPLVKGGCGSNNACAPTPSGSFSSKLCVSQKGNLACPAGPYSDRHVYFEGVLDSRGCSSCACGAPSGAVCIGGATAFIYQDTSCSIIAAVPPVPTVCGVVSSSMVAGSARLTGSQSPSGISTCTPSGGQPTGTAAPDIATTFCCLE